MPLLSDSTARPIPAVTALRFLRGLANDPASVALRFGAMLIKEYVVFMSETEHTIVDGAKENEGNAASAACWNTVIDEDLSCMNDET